jgi:5-methylcytosine-specific restriction protein A
MPNTDDFKAALNAEFQEAIKLNRSWIDINSGDLHRKLGGYPSKTHQMPTCCNAMYEKKRAGDEVISQPPKGKGATLTIRYKLPR